MAEAMLHPPAVSLEPAAPVMVLGVAFDPMTLAGAVERIERMVASRLPHYVVTRPLFSFQAASTPRQA